ncbi:phosphoenolpyruvate-protein phosphotransferase [Neokomagataea thailandica NBRC 106555]|uniref:Phosphoenolpyruvate-protein phosphotransferase n=1 Tax=Neokomagataea thailandica NBRC 106555 TaxID=1223520 RepID=A0ABQ0QNN1_9PROT|nr:MULTISPECIES: phosphoenolpyruvate--protein phosphotransferase [Neokomagataea]GBR51574.1 phosphoenolpyruvate-protein phosphotransferase [Neokomagataea thailandica NBRC 106555]
MTEAGQRGRARTKRGQSRILRGRAITQGIGLGAAGRVEALPLPEITTRISRYDVAQEKQRFEEAVARAQRQIEKIRRRLVRLPESGRDDVSGLLTVYDRMLGPSRLTRQVRSKISDEGLTAEAAVAEVSAELAQSIVATANISLPSTDEQDAAAASMRLAGEFEEIGRRLVRNLTGVSYRAFSSLPEGAVLVAEQLRPADIAMIDPARVAAVVTEGNGGADHTAILLRALDIPAIVAVPGLMAQVAEGDMLVVDAHLGTITVNPNATEMRLAREAASKEARERRAFGRIRRLPAELKSGEAIELLANLELAAELPMLMRNGARGIGLLRSEFLFSDEDDLPDEDGQAEVYRAVLDGMAGQPVTIRVFDWGGEKGQDYLRYAGQPQPAVGDNPALGLRGIRLLLKAPEVLETQFAAILKAVSAGDGQYGPVRVLLPMVTSVDEVVAAREIYERVGRNLRRQGVDLPEVLPPLGVMVETPAAALIADALVQHAEFLALGTNDLTMYTLAVNRADAAVADRYSPLHPAVLRLIATTAESALRAHRPLSVCGEMAADPKIVALLIGLGVRSFSMKSASLPRVKRLIRTISFEECDQLRREVMLMTEADAVQDVVRRFAT